MLRRTGKRLRIHEVSPVLEKDIRVRKKFAKKVGFELGMKEEKVMEIESG